MREREKERERESERPYLKTSNGICFSSFFFLNIWSILFKTNNKIKQKSREKDKGIINVEFSRRIHLI